MLNCASVIIPFFYFNKLKMSSYDRRSDNYEVLQARQRAQQRRDQSFSMLGTAGLYSRRGQPVPNRREIERQRRIEELQRQQMLQQMQLQEQFAKEQEEIEQNRTKVEQRRMNGIAVLQNHDEKINILESKISNIISDMQNVDSIFNNVNNKSKQDMSSFERKLEQLENAVRKKSPQDNIDFENTIITRIQNANVKVAQKLEEFEKQIKNRMQGNTGEGSSIDENEIKEMLKLQDTVIAQRLQDTNNKLIKKIEDLESKISNISTVNKEGEVVNSIDTGSIEKMIKTSETGLMQIIQNMEKSINKRIDAEFTKKMEHFDSKLKGIEHKAIQASAVSSGRGKGGGGGNALAMVQRLRDELSDRMSAMERQGGGHGGGMGKTAERFLQQQKTKLEKSTSQLKELQQAYRARELEVDFMFNKIKELNFSLKKKIEGFEEKLFPDEKDKDKKDEKDKKETQNVKLTVSE